MTQNNGGPLAATSMKDAIERRIDTGIVGTIGVSAQRGMQVDGMGQAMEVAKLMSVSGCAVPKHLRTNPGACLAVAIQGWEWGINPFAIANKSYEVNDRLAYEAALYAAVLSRRAPIKGRLKSEYSGEEQTRRCTIWAILSEDGSRVEYTSPLFSRIQPKNSPLWKNDPDQQLYYYSVRAFGRRHFPDVMMGILTADELQDAGLVEQAQPVQTRTQSVIAKVTQRPVSEGHTFEPAELPLQEDQSFTIAPIVPQNDVSETAEGIPAETVDQTTGEVMGDVRTEPEPAQDVPAKPLITHQQLVDAMNEAAMDAGATESSVGKFMNTYAAEHKIQSWTKQTPKWRADAMAAFSATLAK